MASSSNFTSVIGRRVAQFSPEATRQRHIAMARRGAAANLAGRSGEAGIEVTLSVDGHAASSEAQVQPFGVITYVIRPNLWIELARYATAIAREISPVVSGRYRDAWFVMADRIEVDPDAIPPSVVELILVNDVPYARMIQFRGARRVGVPPGIVERVREHVLQRFGAEVIAQVTYITLPGGYVLKHTGEEMTYPALAMRLRK